MSGEGHFIPFCTRCAQPLTTPAEGSAADGFLLTCQHFLCGKCARESETGQCPTCRDPAVQVTTAIEADSAAESAHRTQSPIDTLSCLSMPGGGAQRSSRRSGHVLAVPCTDSADSWRGLDVPDQSLYDSPAAECRRHCRGRTHSQQSEQSAHCFAAGRATGQLLC